MSIIKLPQPVEDVEVTEFQPLPAGEYVARLAEVKEATSKAGNPYLQLTWEVIEPEEFKGRKLFDNLSITYKDKEGNVQVFSRFAKICKIAGVEGDEVDTQDLVGIEVLLSVGTEEYEGKQKNNVKNVAEIG